MAKMASKKGVVESSFVAISPRLFEAAALGVCQILEVDDYLDGAMIPWTHFIPLEPDFSNIEEIFRFIQDPEKAKRVVKSARALLIESEVFSYRAFVDLFLRSEVNDFSSIAGGEVAVVDLDLQDAEHLGPSVEEVVAYFTNTKISRILSAAFSNKYSIPRNILNAKTYSLPETYTSSWMSISSFIPQARNPIS
jgi:hypothetical protein